MRFRECHVLLGFALLFSPAAKATSFNFESDNPGSISVYSAMTNSGWYTPTVAGAAASVACTGAGMRAASSAAESRSRMLWIRRPRAAGSISDEEPP